MMIFENEKMKNDACSWRSSVRDLIFEIKKTRDDANSLRMMIFENKETKVAAYSWMNSLTTMIFEN